MTGGSFVLGRPWVARRACNARPYNQNPSAKQTPPLSIVHFGFIIAKQKNIWYNE